MVTWKRKKSTYIIKNLTLICLFFLSQKKLQIKFDFIRETLWVIMLNVRWIFLVRKGLFHKKNCTALLTRFGFPVKFTVTLLEVSIFYIEPPGNPGFFINFWYTPGIPTTFTLPPYGIFNRCLQQGGLNFFLEKPKVGHVMSLFITNGIGN